MLCCGFIQIDIRSLTKREGEGMSNILQFDLFKSKPTDLEICRQEVAAVRKSCDKVRKGLFARHGELAKMYMDLNQRLDIIERNICRGEK